MNIYTHMGPDRASAHMREIVDGVGKGNDLVVGNV